MARGRRILGLAALACGGALLLYLSRSGTTAGFTGNGQAPGVERGATEAGAGPEDTATEVGDAELALPSVRADRRSRPSPRITGRVVSALRSIERGQVYLHSRGGLDLKAVLVSSPQPIARVHCDGGGEFGLDPGDAPLPLYVVATEAGHWADAVRVEGLGSPITFALEPAEPVHAWVLLQDGEPAAGARVEMYGVVGRDRVGLYVAYEADASGRVSLDPLRGVSALRAVLGGEGCLWTGSHSEVDGDIVLTLGHTFEAGGRVLGAPSPGELAGARVLVRYEPREDGWNEPEKDLRGAIAVAPIGSDGSWSASAIPWRGPGTYVFRLESPHALPIDVLRRMETPPRPILVDLDWSQGRAITFLTVDEQEELRSDVEVTALWRAPGGERWSRTTRITDGGGRAIFPALPEGRLYVRTAGPDLAHQAFGPFDVPTRTGPFTLRVTEASTVRGTCRHGGEPVEDFDVTYWGEDPTARFTERVRGSSGGSFEIRTAPAGPVHLQVHAQGLATVETIVVDAPADDVEVELRAMAHVRGRVIDARTGVEVDAAVVQIYSLHGFRALDPVGPPQRVDEWGGFEGVAFPRQACLKVTSEGYEPRFRDGPSPRGGEVDLGIIALYPLQRVVLELVADRSVPFEEYSAVLGGIGPRDFDTGGRVTFEDVGAGHPYVEIYTPDDRRLDMELSVRPGDEGPYRIFVSGRAVTVDVVSKEPSGEAFWVAAVYQDLMGQMTTAIAALDDSKRAVLESIVGDRVQIQVSDRQAVLMATRWVDLGGGDSHVVVELAGDVCRLRILDQDGDPIAERPVTVRDPGDPVGSPLRRATDRDGIVTLGSIETESVLLRVSDDASSAYGYQTVDLSGHDRTKPIPVVVDRTARLHVRLVERGERAAGVEVAVQHRGDFLRSGTSDANGDVVLAASPEDYEVEIRAGGYWRTTHPARASHDGPPIPVEVRRIGSLRLAFRRGGLPLAGTPVSLVCVESGASAADWVTEHRCKRRPRPWRHRRRESSR